MKLAIAATLGVLSLMLTAARPGYIDAAVADPARPADDRALDAARKPAEVLAFARIRPGERIAEYIPAGGYFTRMLSDIVGPTGHIYALETTTWGKEEIDATTKMLAERGRTNVSLDLAPLGQFHLNDKVDLFWTSLNYHDLHVAKYANVDMLAFNKAVYAALAPGGRYLIIDHAAAPGAGATVSPTLHRIEEATVIREVTAAGFRLERESPLLRDASDDHTRKVFDLHFHTDQFILVFRKA